MKLMMQMVGAAYLFLFSFFVVLPVVGFIILLVIAT